MTTRMVPHPVTTQALPLGGNASVLRPETCVLLFPSGKSVDVGSLCYLTRAADQERGKAVRRRGEGWPVDLATLSASRQARVRTLIQYISDQVEHSGGSEETIRTTLTRFIAFMSWADAGDHAAVLDGEPAARAAFRAYVAYLRELVRTNQLSANSGAGQQNAVLGFLKGFLDIEDLAQGVNLLRKSKTAAEATEPPGEDSQAKVLSLADALFEGLAALVLDKLPYPHRIGMPAYLGWEHNELWVFPSISWFMSPHMAEDRLERRCSCPGNDYRNGRVATVEELMALPEFSAGPVQRARDVVRLTNRQLTKVNADPRHAHRGQMANQAANMFLLLFAAQTGMNQTQLEDLAWADSYEVSVSRQSFRVIKARAGHRVTHFELPLAFMPKFKRYLALREYILNGRSCDLLFFKIGEKGTGAIGPVKSGFDSMYAMLRRIDPSLPLVKSRKWRAAKSDWFVRNTDIATTAAVLQNSEQTVAVSYAAGSQAAHLEEMSDFLNQVTASVIAKDVDVENGMECAVGVCSDYGAPSTSPGGPVVANCKQAEGCLFCHKYKVHADERDTRKLISCRFCIQQTAPLAGSEERFQETVGPVLDRIGGLLAEISKLDDALVAKVEREVTEGGELDPYWARKLEMLIELGVVA